MLDGHVGVGRQRLLRCPAVVAEAGADITLLLAQHRAFAGLGIENAPPLDASDSVAQAPRHVARLLSRFGKHLGIAFAVIGVSAGAVLAFAKALGEFGGGREVDAGGGGVEGAGHASDRRRGSREGGAARRRRESGPPSAQH